MLWPLIRMLLQTRFGWAILAIGAGAYLLGFNPFSVFEQVPMSSGVQSQKDDPKAVFIKKVITATEDVW